MRTTEDKGQEVNKIKIIITPTSEHSLVVEVRAELIHRKYPAGHLAQRMPSVNDALVITDQETVKITQLVSDPSV